MAMTGNMRISLGPVPYYWSRDDLLDFYARIAETEVDIVYLGETICSKRRSMRSEDWMQLAEELTAAGKEVVLSTMTLIEAGSELGAMKRLCDNGRFTVEANDMGAVNRLSGKHPFTTGPSVNIYNPQTLKVLARQGLKRWVLPVELSRQTLADMQHQRPDGVETEVLVYGRLPLAYSARCFTARAHDLPKDDCQFRCLDYPDGLLLSTRESEDFLVLNGIQTQSAKSCNLIADINDMRSLGVDVLRISPQSRHTERIIRTFHKRLLGYCSIEEASTLLETLMPGESCNGYWHGTSGMDACKTPEALCP
jgi:O2-independent ubiquinone biosynthesis protein UbiV